ncbi:MAG: hypothetical protein ACFFA3_06605 [Promethearchaeota archaeon]
MKDLSDLPEFSKYFRVVSPSEIEVNKDNIFYRDKYNDIMNFIKTMSIYNEDNPLIEYLSPKGALLINTNPGTDIIEFIKLISMNYSLELIELNEIEIKRDPDKFKKSFLQILKSVREKENLKINKIPEGENIEKLTESEKRVIIINQQLYFKALLNDNNMLELFISIEKGNLVNFIESNIILIWINYDIRDVIEISPEIYDNFDLLIKIQLLTKIERETVFRDFLEENPKIVFDINALVNNTENWEVNDIKQLLRVGIFKHFLNSELNETSNEITHILLDLIESGEYIPSSLSKDSVNNPKTEENEENLKQIQNISKIEEDKFKESNIINDYIHSMRESRPSEFMINQLYENAAFLNYNELLLIIDKINKKEPLEENDRNLLAKFPFILSDPPKRAQLNLEKAKKRVDRIKQAFGK